MYVIVKTGGKQYKVEKNTVFDAELIDANIGEIVKLDAVMYADDEKVLVGQDAAAVNVEAEVVKVGKGKKITVFTYKAKKNVRRKKGHRQPFCSLKITNISIN